MDNQRWPALMNRKVATEYLGISKTEFDRLLADRKLVRVALRPNADPRYRRSDLDAFLESLESI